MSRIAPLPAGDLPEFEAFHRAGPLGFLNRFNDTMPTELEAPAIAVGQEFLASHGWSVGKHGTG